jgi:rhodanese-related sulfurtransferase
LIFAALQNGRKPVSVLSLYRFEQHPSGSQGFLIDLIKLTNDNRGKRIDLICARGGRSKWLRRRLEKLGYTHVNDVTEGMVGGWGKKG